MSYGIVATCNPVRECRMGMRKRKSMTFEPRTRTNRRQPGRGAPSRNLPRDDFRVVGLGASAGGLEALYKLFDELPDDTGMAFILVLHLDPTHSSMMVDLLTGHTAMKVSEATDGMLIERDHVYVIPPGVYLSISEGALRLTNPRERHGARMPFDFFLRSLAKDCGARAICAILSGTGSDGTAGLLAIRDQGRARYRAGSEGRRAGGMPRSAIQTGAVDFVLPAAAIPAALLKHRNEPIPKPTLGARARGSGDRRCRRLRTGRDHRKLAHPYLARFCPLQGGHAEAPDRTADGIRVDQGHRSVSDTIRQDPREIDRLAKDILINVTQFFRDEKTFDFLADKILPELIRRQPPAMPIRIWDAGCSTGEETYSIAMLFLEAIASAKRNVQASALRVRCRR